MTRAELEALARRVETEEPSRELDAEVWRAVGAPIFVGELNYTTSLDAAETLVLDGCDWDLRARHKYNEAVFVGADWADRYPPKTTAHVWKMANPGLYAVRERGNAATPAAALTAAALRARAAEAPDA
jgi:hypothetical protein